MSSSEDESRVYWRYFYSEGHALVGRAKSTAANLRLATGAYAALAMLGVVGIALSATGGATSAEVAVILIGVLVPLATVAMALWALSLVLDLSAVRTKLALMDSAEDDDLGEDQAELD